MGAIGPLFGLSQIQSIRAGLLLAAGGEFAFVALYAPAFLTPTAFTKHCLVMLYPHESLLQGSLSTVRL